MSTHKCCQRQKLRRGLWSPDEDEKLLAYIVKHGPGNWSSVPEHAGIERCGKSCRLRWINYLRPDLKRGSYSELEESRIIDLHTIYGNKWSKIASHLPGRTDNEIKNLWNSSLRKRIEKKTSACRILPTMGALSSAAENAAQLSRVSESLTGPCRGTDTISLACSSSLPPIFPFHPAHEQQSKKNHVLPPQNHNVNADQASLSEAPIISNNKLQQIINFNHALITHDQVHAGHDVPSHEGKISINILQRLNPNILSILVANDHAIQNSLQQTEHNSRLLRLQNAASYIQAAARYHTINTQNDSSQHHSKETLLWLNNLIEDHSSPDNGGNQNLYHHQYEQLVSNTTQSTSSTCSDDSSINIPSLFEYQDVTEFWLEEASHQL